MNLLQYNTLFIDLVEHILLFLKIKCILALFKLPLSVRFALKYYAAALWDVSLWTYSVFKK